MSMKHVSRVERLSPSKPLKSDNREPKHCSRKCFNQIIQLLDNNLGLFSFPKALKKEKKMNKRQILPSSQCPFPRGRWLYEPSAQTYNISR